MLGTGLLCTRPAVKRVLVVLASGTKATLLTEVSQASLEW